VTHSEFNRGAEPLHLYQLWLFPRERGLAPLYEQRVFPAEARRNALLPVVSGQGVADALSMNCDATIFLADLEAGRIVRHRPEALARFITIYVTSGDLEVNYERLRPGDQARITQREMLTIRPLADTRFILIDAPPRS
jgi:redox-sensitive bicupin YhaK (pirin superfamily)